MEGYNMLEVQKRNGDIVPFDKEKIIDAVNRAMIEVDKILYETDTSEDIATEIEEMAKRSKTTISVETIQDCVEDLLMQSERRDVARAYIRYRYKQEAKREHEAVFVKTYSEKLEARNVQNQNANVDEHSFGGRAGEARDELLNDYALNYIVSDMSKNNHLNTSV